MQKIALLESEKHGGRMGPGSVASVALHVVVLAFAVAVTSHAGRDFNYSRAIFIPLPKWQPNVSVAKHEVAPAPRRSTDAAPRVPAISVTILTVIPPSIPAPSSTQAPPTELGATGTISGSAQGSDTVSALLAGNSPLEQYQVDFPAAALSGQRGPVYPEGLRAMGVGGRVVARFIIEKNGRVESEPTLVFSTADEFASAVKRYLSTARYRPAMYKGQPVRQLAEQEFEFSVRR
jgi:TonB family protein